MSNIKFFPPKTIADIDSMNEDELLEGYRAGFNGKPRPKDSRAKWTGWRNGMVDSGRMKIDEAQRSVAHQYIRGNHEKNIYLR